MIENVRRMATSRREWPRGFMIPNFILGKCFSLKRYVTERVLGISRLFRIQSRGSWIHPLGRTDLDTTYGQHWGNYWKIVANLKNTKYYEEFQRLGIPSSKYIYMALIHVFVNSGNFLKAKEIVKDERKHEKYLTEIKSAFIIALMSNGKVSEAFQIYDEIKQAGDVPESKAVRSLIESLGKQGKFTEMFQLLHEYKDKEEWCYACSLTVLSCIKHKQLSSAIDLLRQLKEMDRSLVDIVCDQIFYLICETDKPNLEDGLALLQAMRTDMDLQPSRMGLDFLLTACVSRKNSNIAKLVFEEYIREGIPYNVLTFLRIFQVFLASGKQKDAALILEQIPKKDLKDSDIQYLIKMYVKHYKCRKIILPF